MSKIRSLGSYGIEFLNNKDERVGELEHVLKNNGYVLVNQENLEQLKNSENFVAQKAYEFISKNYDLDSKKLKDRDGFELLYLSPMLFENPDMEYSRAKEMESQYGIEITAANRHLSQVSSYSSVSYDEAMNTSYELMHVMQTDLDYQADLMTDAIVRFAETGVRRNVTLRGDKAGDHHHYSIRKHKPYTKGKSRATRYY